MRSASYIFLLLAVLGACSDDKTVVTTVPCGASFPPAPPGTKQVVYVAKNCPADGADGSRDRPFTSVQQGLNRAEAGASVLVAPGQYDESVSMSRPVSLVGAPSDSYDESVVMKPQGLGGSVATENDDDEVAISGVRIEGATGYGLLLGRGHLVLTDVVIAATARGSVNDAGGQTAEVGFGLAATGGRLDATRLTVDGSADSGVIIDGASGALRESRVSNSGLGGVIVQRVATDFAVDACTLADNTQLGIGIFAGPVTLTGTTVSATRLHPATGIGDGVLVSHYDQDTDTSPIVVKASGNTVTGSERVGLLLGVGSEGEASDNIVSDSAAKAPFGAGVWLQGKAGGASGLTMRRNSIRRSRFVGFAATSGSRATFEQGTIEQTASGSVFLPSGGSATIGDGVGLFDQSVVQLRGNVIKASPRYGVALDGADLASLVQDNTIDSDPGAPMKAGVAIQQGGNASMLAGLVSGNTQDGVSDEAPTVTKFDVRKENFAAAK